MATKHDPIRGLFLLLCLATPLAGRAAEDPAVNAASYTDRGADTCLKCHDEESKFPVFSIFKTRHAQAADPRTPFGTLQCEACHGPGAQHAVEVPEGQKQAPIIAFGRKSAVPAEQQNKVCLGCHKGGDRIAWNGGSHGRADVTCVSCHRIHATHDAVRTTAEQPGVSARDGSERQGP